MFFFIKVILLATFDFALLYLSLFASMTIKHILPQQPTIKKRILIHQNTVYFHQASVYLTVTHTQQRDNVIPTLWKLQHSFSVFTELSFLSFKTRRLINWQFFNSFSLIFEITVGILLAVWGTSLSTSNSYRILYITNSLRIWNYVVTIIIA